MLSWTVKSLTLHEGKIKDAHTLVEGVFFLKVPFLANILYQNFCFHNFNIIYNSNNNKSKQIIVYNSHFLSINNKIRLNGTLNVEPSLSEGFVFRRPY